MCGPGDAGSEHPDFDDPILNENFDDIVLDPHNVRRILDIWRLRCLRAARVHYQESLRIQFWGNFLTIFNALSTIAVGLLSVAGFFSNNYYISLLSLISGFFVIATSIYQYILQPEYKNSSHKIAANEFSNIHRKIERYQCLGVTKMGVLHTINRDINWVTKAYPSVAGSVWRKNEHMQRIDDYEQSGFFDTAEDEQAQSSPKNGAPCSPKPPKADPAASE